MPPVSRSKATSDGSEGLWRWIAAIVGALLVGLTPFLLTLSSQRDYAQKDDLALLAQQVVTLSERVARNEEQTLSLVDTVDQVLAFSQNGETRLSEIEAALARIEAILSIQQPPP